MPDEYQGTERVQTGIAGLDHILRGGLVKGMVYLIHGGPGTGKTTLGFQFLQEGVRCGDHVLYVSLLQTREELNGILHSHKISLDGIEVLELPDTVRRASTEEQTLFASADIELHEMMDVVLDAIVELRPQRLVFDSITELAVLVDNPYQLRRQLLKLKQQLSGLGCTSLFTVNDTQAVDLPSVQTVVHGVIEMGIDRTDFGTPRRWLDPTKMRGMWYLEGRHDFRIKTGGLEVYPRVEVETGERRASWNVVSSGNPEIDVLFGGGLEQATACLITGTTGAGKSTLAAVYANAAAERGERSAMFCFDERPQTLLRRAAALGLDLGKHVDDGVIDLRQVNVGSITPGHFAHEICRVVEEEHVKVVVIDSINGYVNAMAEQRQLMVQLHELLSYLSCAGVLTLLVNAVHGLTVNASSEIDTSYIADTVVLMRNFEAVGQMRHCISVLKKRHGNHERTIREVRIGQGGICVGQPLVNFRGVLSGRPEFTGSLDELMTYMPGDDR